MTSKQEIKIETKLKNANDVNEKNDLNEEADDWDSIYNECGESIVKKFEKLDIKTNYKKSDQNEEEIELNKTKENYNKIDYFKFKKNEPENNVCKNKSGDDEEEEIYGPEFSHILEIYDFPNSFKNENILNAFKEITSSSEMTLKWIDDTHCLGIFANTEQANNALKMENMVLKVRPIQEASAESKRIAKRRIDQLKPYKSRPQTSSLVASNLISASLGMRNLLSKEKIAQERKKLASARDKINRERDLKESIWNGTS